MKRKVKNDAHWKFIYLRKRMIAIYVSMLLISFSLFAQQPLDNMVEMIWQQNAGIQAMQNQMEMLKEKETLVQKLMDPMLAIEYSSVPIDSWVLDETPMSGIQFKLQQTFPFPGKNNLREEIASSELTAKNWELEEMKLQLAGQFKKIYASLAMVRQLEKKSEKHITLLLQLKSSLQTKYETGKANQHDLLRLDIMVQKLQDDLKDFRQKDNELTAALNSILNRNYNEPILINNLITIEISEKLTELLETARQNRPLLKKMEQEEKTQRLEMKLAHRDRLPDLTIWAGYRYRQDIGTMESPDFASVGISFPIPFDFLGRTRAKYKMFNYKRKAVENSYNDAIAKLSAQLEKELSSYQRANEKMATYENDLIPNAENALKMTLAAYENGKADFSSIYQAQLQILDFERTLIKTNNQILISQFSIEALTGFKEK
ncbi:MAG: TolC family protein [Candidatus Cloacimonetes bacterium]|nr:TolC family protein [Candidatus Cloacimonadota bacterium]MCF7813151.1 TolC family protein [Candidatus Cloacimonadota bacterium]MCF7867599.1 TolC family protein [Candidatus Cloacimonadota bacterium]MCF7883126.1 TolC family protein [Candidatus Cloacimonadota bacterium]